jgi:hypothetical protein
MPTARMREDEEFAKSRFEAYVRSRLPKKTIVWTPGDEPPDYYLTVGQDEFAVEITTLMDKVTTPRKEVTVEGLYASYDDFVKEIEAEASKSGILSGEYCVTFAPAHLDIYRKRKILQNEVLDFIRNTQTYPEVTATNMEIDGLPYCSIFKGQGKIPRVCIVGYPFVSKWDGEAIQQSYIILQNAIDTKAKKPAQLQKQKILVLRSTAVFSQVEIYRDFLPKVTNLQFFHTVFIIGSWIETTRRDYVLYTVDPGWN